MAEQELTTIFLPIIVNDGLENWCLFPEDAAYPIALKIPPDDKGIRQVDPEVTEGLHTWWWRQAVERAEKIIDDLAIPWGELAITDLDVQDGNLMILSEKLARISFYIVQVGNRMVRLSANNYAAREMLDHAVNRNLARETGEKKPAIAVRMAAAISKDKRLRNLKIETIESGAALKALEATKDSLDTLWRTTSRIMSVRQSEPIE